VGEPGNGRYQMREGFSLPKFISPKNPFKREGETGVVSARETSTATATSIAGASDAPDAAAVSGRLAAPKGRSGAGQRWRQLAKKAGAVVGRTVLFCVDHNPFSAIGKPRLAGIPRLGKPAVQGELSLDRVKVVRNDLTHADLEVVPLRSGPKQG